MSGAINWIGTWYKPSGPLSGVEIAGHYTHLLTEGLHARISTSHRRNAPKRKPSPPKTAKASR
jgi:hypothetical protein